MTPALNTLMEQSRARCEARLQALSHIQPQDARASNALAGLEDAVRYALQAGGKRIRPCLVYALARGRCLSKVCWGYWIGITALCRRG